MAERPFQRVRRFLAELKRRNVYQVAVTYAVVGFVAIQAANLIFPALEIPPWAYSMVVVLVLLGFPFACVLAWAFEMTPEGVRRTPEAAPPGGRAEATGAGERTGYGVLLALGLGAAAVVGGWYLTGGGGEAPRGPRLGDRSIAVLPFQALGQERPGAFTAGMHDALLTRLSNVSGLKVISRTAVRQYRDTEQTTGEIARELGVRWVLEGGVQKLGDHIRVNAQLIDPREETHAWAEDYQRDLAADDLFALQSEITKRIARSLQARLTPEEADRVERRPTESLDAYRLYVQGRTHLDRRTESGMRRGLTYFRRALQRDSSYALAWSGLADALTLLASYGHAAGDTVYPRALVAARRALEIDPELAEAHASLGLLHHQRRDGPAALRNLRRAVELKPSYARAHHWLGNVLGTLGRLDAALPRLERAAELNPMSPSAHVALSATYYYAGRLEEALAEARRTEELEPGYALGPYLTGSILSAMGRQREAADALRRALERGNPAPDRLAEARAWLAVAHHRAGRPDRARRLLGEIEGSGRFPFAEAIVHAERGEHDAAIRALGQADVDYVQTVILRYDSVFEPLRDEPGFHRLLGAVNQHWGLNPDGSLPDGSRPGPDAGPNRGP